MGQVWFVVVTGILAFGLGSAPVAHHLLLGSREKRNEILCYFNAENIKLYFQEFFEKEVPTIVADPQAALQRLYDERFGRRTYVLPVVIYTMSLVVLVVVIGYGISEGSIGWQGAKLETSSLYALAGAYLWVVYDLISRHRQRDLTPSVLYWYAFRFLTAIPVAYAITILLLKPDAAAPVAFMLGVFPTNTLMLILRRQASQKLGLGDDPAEKKMELEKLQGVNTSLAEKFSEIGVTTLLDLAYEDPIQLSMRTNLPFSYIVDIASQALSTVYGLDVEVTGKYSVRGAIEAADVYNDFLNKEDAEKSARAKAIIGALAKELQVPDAVIEQKLHNLSSDSYIKFLREIWR